MKKKYSLHYERYFYKFMPLKVSGPDPVIKRYLQMKRFKRLLAILLTLGFLAGMMTSCAVFDDSSHAMKKSSFKHTKPLPKKWVLDNGEKPILK